MLLAQAWHVVLELQLEQPGSSVPHPLHEDPLSEKPAVQLRHAALELQVRQLPSRVLHRMQLPPTSVYELLAQAVHAEDEEQFAQPVRKLPHVAHAVPLST